MFSSFTIQHQNINSLSNHTSLIFFFFFFTNSIYLSFLIHCTLHIQHHYFCPYFLLQTNIFPQNLTFEYVRLYIVQLLYSFFYILLHQTILLFLYISISIKYFFKKHYKKIFNFLKIFFKFY